MAFLSSQFSNANGVTFGTATTSNGIVVTGSHNGLTSQLNQAFSASGGSSAFQTLSFNNTNGVTFSNNAGAVEVTHGLQYTSNTSAITSAALNTSSPRINVSAGTTSNNLSAITFNNANGITFGLNASTVTASHNGITTARASNDGVGLNTAGTNVTWTVNSSGISLNGDGYAGTGTAFSGTNVNGSITLNSGGLSIQLNNTDDHFSGWTLGGNVLGTTSTGLTTEAGINFVGGANITLSGNSNSITIIGPTPGGAATVSYHALVPWPNQTHTTSWGQSTSGVYPFVISQPLSMDRVRMLYSGSVAASSTQGTTGNTSLSMSGVTSHNFVFYSRGAGANSLSLQYVTSTQHVDRQLVTISYAANSTQMSYSNRLTLGTASFTKDYSSSAASQNFHTSNLTDLTGVRYIDIPAELSLSAGQWWVVYGRSTASATQANSISVATRMLVSHNSQIGVSMNTLAIGMIGGNTNSSVGFFPAHGSFTLGGAAGTTSSITMANVSTAASNHMLHMQFMRIT